MKNLFKKCPECGNKELEVMKTYCGEKSYVDGKPKEKGSFPKRLATTKYYCEKCNWEKEI